MKNAIALLTKTNVRATTETRHNRYGTPCPTMTLRITADVHPKAVQALAHLVAAQLEMELLGRDLECLVVLGDGVESVWEAKRRAGSKVEIALELVWDGKRHGTAAEETMSRDALDTVAFRVNKGRWAL